jgi:hypothetical protein
MCLLTFGQGALMRALQKLGKWKTIIAAGGLCLDETRLFLINNVPSIFSFSRSLALDGGHGEPFAATGDFRRRRISCITRLANGTI